MSWMRKLKGLSAASLRLRIENLLMALYRSTEYFNLARTFRTAWGGGTLFLWMVCNRGIGVDDKR